jgi:hypothetical protein
MSADELRRAAEAERREWGGDLNARLWPSASALHLALADWLDDAAARRYHTPTPPDHALIVARLINGPAS